MVNPRMAPPVPSKPAENPDKIPPVIEFSLLGSMTNYNKLSTTKKIPNNSSNNTVSK